MVRNVIKIINQCYIPKLLCKKATGSYKNFQNLAKEVLWISNQNFLKFDLFSLNPIQSNIHIPKLKKINILRHQILVLKICFSFNVSTSILDMQCPPLNRITLSRLRSGNNNRMIQITDVFCALLIYTWASDIWLQ